MQPMPVPEIFSTCLRDPAITPEVVVRCELPKAVLKHLRPLGHEVTLFEVAAVQLMSRLEKGRFEPGLADFLQRWRPKVLPLGDDAELLTLLLKEGAHGWQIAGSSLDWLNDPAWAALLHLPALRAFWAANLRASHLDHLRQFMPHAWFMDATPLPPGSIIAGLGIGSWDELPQLREQGRGLVIHEQQVDFTIEQALKSGGAIMVEPASGQGTILARYSRDTDGIQISAAWVAEGADIRQVM